MCLCFAPIPSRSGGRCCCCSPESEIINNFSLHPPAPFLDITQYYKDRAEEDENFRHHSLLLFLPKWKSTIVFLLVTVAQTFLLISTPRSLILAAGNDSSTRSFFCCCQPRRRRRRDFFSLREYTIYNVDVCVCAILYLLLFLNKVAMSFWCSANGGLNSPSFLSSLLCTTGLACLVKHSSNDTHTHSKKCEIWWSRGKRLALLPLRWTDVMMILMKHDRSFAPAHHRLSFFQYSNCSSKISFSEMWWRNIPIIGSRFDTRTALG